LSGVKRKFLIFISADPEEEEKYYFFVCSIFVLLLLLQGFTPSNDFVIGINYLWKLS